MRVWLHAAAQREVAHAVGYLRSHAAPGTDERFLAELDRVVALLSRAPGLGRPQPRGRRILLLRSFPCAVVYVAEPERSKVLAVRHQRQRPGVGLLRRG